MEKQKRSNLNRAGWGKISNYGKTKECMNSL